MTLALILLEVSEERARQEQLKAEGRFTYTCADVEPCGMTDAERCATLGEEFGEVCRAALGDHLVNDSEGLPAMRKECIQVAAVAVAIVESIDKRAAS